MIRILNLGAGVQSSTLLLMAARGELEHVPDHAIFADTGWEPKAVYEWLDFLEEEVRGVIPIHRVSAGNIREDVLAKNTRYASPPFRLRNLEGKEGMTRRQCTKGYKIEPIEKKLRELVGIAPRSRGPKEVVVEQWYGISLDEVGRMRTSEVRWRRYEYPLIDLRMTRHGCLKWMERHGYPAPAKSACIGCPYHSDAIWREMKEKDPESWEDAVDFDRRIREVGLKGLEGVPYLHRSLQPLDEVDLSTAEDRGQLPLFDDGMQEECEGMCGL